MGVVSKMSRTEVVFGFFHLSRLRDRKVIQRRSEQQFLDVSVSQAYDESCALAGTFLSKLARRRG